ncbi:MAG: CaiB/BaiF CoA transferase family protein [Promethearchaeota archaeon]
MENEEKSDPGDARVLPLSGVRVLDLSRLLPAPYAVTFLADLGADVIRVEEPGFGDLVHWAPPFFEAEKGPKRRRAALDLYLNRNKRSVGINLKAPEGRDIFYKLVETADVVVESSRPGVAEKLGVDYETLREINPGLVYCSVTGYGQDGPYRDLPGHDINYVSIAGLLGVSGPKERPVVPVTQVADLGGGSVMSVLGILAALFARERTGEGQYIDASMTDGAMAFNPLLWSKFFAERVPQPREGFWSVGGDPYYNVFETRGGGHVSVGLIEQKFWEQFCDAVGRPELKPAQFAKTEAEREGLFATMADLFKERTRDEWFEFFKEHDIPGTPVYDLHEVPEDPHVKARGLFQSAPHPDFGEVPFIRFPLKFSTFRPSYRTHAPRVGEHTLEVLEGLGYDRAELRKLKRRQVVGW